MSKLSDLLSKIQQSDVVTKITGTLAGFGLIPADWVTLDPELAIVNAVSATFATFWNSWAWFAINGGFLDTASGVWLTLLASNVFNVQRIAATFASGSWTGTNSTGGSLGPFGPGALLFYNLDTNVVYSNTASVTFAPGASTISIAANSVIGSAGNAAPSRVALLTTILGLSGSNAVAVTGLDVETDDALKSRCRLKYYSLSPNGPSQAYQYVALTPSLNGGVSVNRVNVSPSSVNGTVLVTFASPSGPPINGSADVTAVNLALYAQVVPDTVNLTTVGALAHSIPVTWVAYYHASANIVPATELANGNAALVTAFQVFPIGGDAITPGSGKVYFDRLVAVLGAALPKAFQITISAPSGDVAILSTEVPTLGTVPNDPNVAIQVVA